MSRITWLALGLICTLAMTTGCQKNVDVDAEKAAVRQVLDSYITSIENEDIGLYGRIMSHDPEMVNFGTDAVERIVGWDALEILINAQNVAWSGTKITASDVTVNLSTEGRFAWATSIWDLKVTIADQPIDISDIRCTWVLEKLQTGWVIVHLHKSIGVAG